MLLSGEGKRQKRNWSWQHSGLYVKQKFARKKGRRRVVESFCRWRLLTRPLFFFFLVKGLDKPNISAKRAGCEQSGSHVILLMSGKQPYFHWQQNGKRRWLVPLTSPCRTCRQLARSRIAHMPVFAILLLLKCLENFGSEKVTSLFTVLLQGNWW